MSANPATYHPAPVDDHHLQTVIGTAVDGAGLFRQQSVNYSQFRPRYPDELYTEIQHFIAGSSADASAKVDTLVDIACGSGQATLDLAKFANRVVGIDGSEEQLAEAKSGVSGPVPSHVEFRSGNAEHLPEFSNSSVDVLTVAQALHWFKLDEFYDEVGRVLKPNGVFATWGYSTNTLNNADAMTPFLHLYNETLGPYWSPKRLLIDSKYKGMEPPSRLYKDVTRRELDMVKEMPLREFLGYVSSWSAYNSFIKANGKEKDPLPAFREDLLRCYQTTDDSTMVTVTWPLFLILARKS